MAAIKERNTPGHWTISVYHGTKRGDDGKFSPDFEYVPFEGTEAEARVEAERLERLKKAGRSVKTFKPLLEKWLDDRKNDLDTDRNLAQNSFETYYFHVQRLIPAIGDVQLQNATARQLMGLLDVALKDVSREYQKRVYITLRAVVRYAAGERLMQDISAGLKAPAVRRKHEKKVVPEDNIMLLLQALAHTKWYLVFRLLVINGIRISEALGLKWSCVDFGKGAIKILDAANVQHRTLNGGTKTDASEREIPLDAETLALLREHRDRQKRQPTPIQGQGLVFRTDDGRLLHYGSLNRSLSRALKKAGYERYTPHEFRHTFVTLLKNAGLKDKVVQDASGHACAQSSQPYTHSLKKGLNLLTELHLDETLDGQADKCVKASNSGVRE